MMKLTFKPLEKKDYKKAIYFAVEGMNFERYMENELLLNLYGRYFLYMELNRATQILALYAEDELAGILLAEIKGEKRNIVLLDSKYMLRYSIFYKIYLLKKVKELTRQQMNKCLQHI